MRGRSRRKTPKKVRPQSQAANLELPSRVVGIGASAGGLEAFSELLRYLPAKTGMAFVFIQHLEPKQRSRFQKYFPG
jgi:two-component system, chemotaxis family, CheB/CheR fusion protein